MVKAVGCWVSSDFLPGLTSARMHRTPHRLTLVLNVICVVGLLAGGTGTAAADIDVSDVAGVTILPVDHSAVPDNFDWRTAGTVTPVKNEGSCDASWAFGITGLVEGYHVRIGHPLVSLSEQQLLDCDSFGTACSGGRPVGSMREMIAGGGLTTEADYPYTARPGSCKSFTPGPTIPGAGRVPPGDELSLKTYLATTGPVLALIDASHASFADYTGGIYSEPACATMQPTRAMLIIGYGIENNVPYWVAKNSQGTSWGEQGYFRLVRNANNACGIASYAFTVANDPIIDAEPVPALGPTALVALAMLFALAAVAVLTRYPR